MLNNRLTDICRIGVENLTSDEVEFSRKFTLQTAPVFATLRMQSEGVFGVFINGEFVEAHKGLLVNRIFCVEITPYLKAGENEIRFTSGMHYFQSTAQSFKVKAGFNFTYVASEIYIESDCEKMTLVTDTSWSASGGRRVSSFGEITRAEYERFWLHAALWQSLPREAKVHDKILEVAGEKYLEYLSRARSTFQTPVKVISSNCTQSTGEFDCISEVVPESDNYVLYDFGKIVVGYTVIEYKASADTEIVLEYDYTENPQDFIKSDEPFVTACENRLKLRATLKKSETQRLIIHRRAARYILIKFPKDLELVGIKIKTSYFPSEDRGWFDSNDELLNKMWSVGKYTLQINRHEEYESCPRHEMKFFSGDGIMEALVDYYVSGCPSLTDATLSIIEPGECTGIVANKLSRNLALWDYPAWRIIMLYNYYLYFGNLDSIKCYYTEATGNLEWMLERLDRDNLVYQHTVYADPFFSVYNSIEYTGSEFRLGRKTYLNVLFYKSFACMASLGRLFGDERADEWKRVAEAIKDAINSKLWSEEKGAYIDEGQPHYVPHEGNALAVLFGVAEGDRVKKALDSLKENNWTEYGSTILSEKTPHTRKGNEMISPMMCTYEAESRFLNNDSLAALDLMKRCWGSMVNKGAESFWEFAPNNDSRWIIPAHGWSSGCVYLFGAYVMGIRPVGAGYEKILFSPCGDIGDFSGVVPTNKGDVAVKCRVTDNGKKVYTLVVPKGADVILDLPDNTSADIVEY